MSSFVFADIAMMPGGIIAWLVVGLIAGFLAGKVMDGGGFGLIGDIVVGLVGSLIGGFVTSYFVQGVMGFWGSIGVSFIGACLLIAIGRALAPARRV